MGLSFAVWWFLELAGTRLHVIRRGIAFGLGIILIISVLSFQGGPAKAARTWDVQMYGDDMNNVYQYIPQNITISVGDTVNWTDVSGLHSTTSDAGQGEWWDSGILSPGESYSHTFTVSGSFTYWSTYPMDIDMVGAVVVRQAVPEFPGPAAMLVIAVVSFAGLLVERRLRSEHSE
ncbi:MAG TPA: plastocyanin/azurin family copper-binding protein [Conexivisphaerales archaeon]|nr:plastocyanin/azurin family copper-binding protein [Conexivisphaerales archaeon]